MSFLLIKIARLVGAKHSEVAVTHSLTNKSTFIDGVFFQSERKKM